MESFPIVWLGNKYFIGSGISGFWDWFIEFKDIFKGFGLVKEGLFNGFSSFMLVIWTSDKYGNEYINYFSALWGRNSELSNKI